MSHKEQSTPVAEITRDNKLQNPQASTSSCCSVTEQSSCCESSAKASCCSSEQPAGSCACK